MDIQQLLSLSSPSGPASSAKDGSPLDEAAFADSLALLAEIDVEAALADGPAPKNTLEQAGLPPEHIQALQAALRDGDLEALTNQVAAGPTDLDAMQDKLALIQRTEQLSAGATHQKLAEPMAQAKPLEPMAQVKPLETMAPAKSLEPMAQGLYRNVATQRGGDPDVDGARPSPKEHALNHQMASLAPAPASDTKATLNMATQRRIEAPPPSIQSLPMESANVTPESGSRQGPMPDMLGLNAQAQVATGAPAAAANTQPTMPTLPATVGTPDWNNQLGQQMIRLGRAGGEQRVELRLHPAELGPLTVQLKMGDQGAQAQLLSAHAPVRQALEQALPQLREALADQGIELSEANVGEHPQGSNADGQTPGNANGQGADPFSTGDDATDAGGSGHAIAQQPVTLDGRIDLYA